MTENRCFYCHVETDGLVCRYHTDNPPRTVEECGCPDAIVYGPSDPMCPRGVFTWEIVGGSKDNYRGQWRCAGCGRVTGDRPTGVYRGFCVRCRAFAERRKLSTVLLWWEFLRVVAAREQRPMDKRGRRG